MKIFLLVFTSLKVHCNSKDDQFWQTKVKPLDKSHPSPIRTFISTLVIDVKVQHSTFLNKSYLDICCY